MFTGIVEAVGTLNEVTRTAERHHLRLTTGLAGEMSPGDSLAVNGVCLTVTGRHGDDVEFDIGPETARVTTLGSLRAGDAVNLERPLRLDRRLDGHLVLGHVDGVGVIDDIRAESDAHWLTIRYQDAFAAFVIRKGSIAVDGVSLTVADLLEGQFMVQIIPYTWTATTLHTLAVGRGVNLECDMIGKYVVRALEIAGQR